MENFICRKNVLYLFPHIIHTWSLSAKSLVQKFFTIPTYKNANSNTGGKSTPYHCSLICVSQKSTRLHMEVRIKPAERMSLNNPSYHSHLITICRLWLATIWNIFSLTIRSSVWASLLFACCIPQCDCRRRIEIRYIWGLHHNPH